MTKKILVLSGSPRYGGNSDILCDSFIAGAEKRGHITEKIYVNDMNIGTCQACYVCKKTGRCFIKDDMQEILDKMINADVIVMATPVYFYSMDGQMKTLIDRTLPKYTKIMNKDFYILLTAAAGKEAMERAVDGFRGFTDCLEGAVIKGIIYGEGVYKKGEILNTNKPKKAFTMGFNA